MLDTPLVRIAGLPAAALDRLRCDEATKWAEDLVRTRRRLAADADALAGRLHEVIGAHSGSAVKPALVGLRRSLHQVRRPSAREWTDEVRAALGTPLAEAVGGWISRRAAWQDRHTALPDVLSADLRRTLDALREIGADPGFRRALSQASPSLFAELTKWLGDERARPKRQTVVRLAKYVGRAAAKTSPYSTFTSTGPVRWAPDGPAVRREPADVRGVVELNGFLVQSLLRAVVTRPDVRAALPLRVNPSATRDGGTLVFVGRGTREPLVTVPVTAALERCLAAVREGGTAADVARALRPQGDADGAAARYVATLIDAGLVEHVPPIADQAADPLGDLADWLRGIAEPDAADLVDAVRAEVGRDVPVSDVDGHVRRHRALAEAVDRLAASVGVPAEAVNRMGRKGVFHENAVHTAPPVTLSRARWEPALADLDAVRRWLAVLDPALPVRLALADWVRERFGDGARMPLLLLHRAVQKELEGCSGPTGAELVRLLTAPPLIPVPLADSPLPRLQALDDLRRAARALVTGHTGAAGTRIDPAALHALADSWPDWVTPIGSLAFYLQAVGDHPVLVVNAAHTGYGRARNRFARLSGAGTTGPAAAETGTMLAEFGGMFATSLNVRAPAVPYEIDYPYTHSTRDARSRIPYGDLSVTHEPDTGLLRLVHAGRTVRPLHLGMMADLLLPPAARFAVEALGEAHYIHLGMLLASPDGSPPAAGTVVTRPRIEVGRVVLRRARWAVRAADVPARDDAGSDSEHLLRLTEWRTAHGIPDRCFVRIWTGPAPAAGTWDRKLLDKTRKPVYVDFGSWWLLLVLDRLLTDPQATVVFDEALPQPGDQGQPAEFVVELPVDRHG